MSQSNEIVKKVTRVLLSVGIALSLPLSVRAQGKTYPALTRSYIMTWCFLEKDPPNTAIEAEVVQRMRTCLCMTDIIQMKYSEDRFLSLIEASKQTSSSPESQELKAFLENEGSSCL
jgi:hypothetical protein